MMWLAALNYSYSGMARYLCKVLFKIIIDVSHLSANRNSFVVGPRLNPLPRYLFQDNILQSQIEVRSI